MDSLADVQPSEQPERGAGLEWSFDDQARALFVTMHPPAEAPEIDEAWLINAIEQRGHGKLCRLPEAMGLAVARYNAGSEVEALRVAEAVDAHWQLKIAPDQLSASLHIEAAQGGRPVSESEVLDALIAQGVVEGVLYDELTAAVNSGVHENRVIARGRAPVDGQNGWLENLLPQARSRVPQQNEAGQVDFRELGEIQTVHAGDALMRLHPPTEGQDGVCVRGKPVPAKPGKRVSFATHLQGTQIDPDDPHRLLAAMVGQPVEVKDGMIVEPMVAFQAVDMSSGNVRFEGSVVVRGDVAAGMTIHATGDIEIGGTAEPCTLEAGGNIVVKGGVIGSVGRKDVAESVIRCSGNFTAAFAQQAHVEAGDSIFIDDVAMQCELHAGKHIRVGNRRRGLVIGGRLLAALSITGKVFGSPNRIATLLEIGLSPATHRRLIEITKEHAARAQQLHDLAKLMRFAEQHPERVDQVMLERARSTVVMNREQMLALREEESRLHALASLAHQARVHASTRVYEGVIVKMDMYQYRVTLEHGQTTFGLSSEGLGPLAEPPRRAAAKSEG